MADTPNRFQELSELMLALSYTALVHGFKLYEDPNGISAFPLIEPNGGVSRAFVLIVVRNEKAEGFRPSNYLEPKEVRQFLVKDAERHG